MDSVELFSGCGGLALGTARAGFDHQLMVEWDMDAFNTLTHNKEAGHDHFRDWTIHHGDVRALNWGELDGNVSLVAGGPPCQPFSVGGKHAGPNDERDMWPQAIRAVRELMPEFFLFENVQGLLRESFRDYLGWIRCHLSSPHIECGPEESFLEHTARIDHANDPHYEVVVFPVNAADYGVPQKRKRVIIAGIRIDVRNQLGIVPGQFSLPEGTHSRERLIWDQWISGEYWIRHGINAPSLDTLNKRDLSTINRLSKQDIPPGLPWKTCRDVLHDLGEPLENPIFPNHVFQGGAKIYKGHTGSPIDEPAKSLKAGVHGVPGGENMMVRRDGSVRYFSVRESARLQCMPDEMTFPGSWTESMRQIGNAVPVVLAEIMGTHIHGLLRHFRERNRNAA